MNIQRIFAKITACTLIIIPLTGIADIQSPHSLTVGEGFVDPVGFHDATPTFSWKLPVKVRKQTAYQVQVRDVISSSKVWDSGWEMSEQSVLLPYEGQPLESRQQLYWWVRIRDEEGISSGWSDPAFFELGLLSSADWDAKWIRAKIDGDPDIEQVTWLRKSFNSSENIKFARLHMTAKGMFDVAINGDKVSEDCFANEWPSCENRIRSFTCDVTNQLKSGRNFLEVRLGEIGWKDPSQSYDSEPELLLQLEVTYADGSSDVICSDESWEGTHVGPVLSSSIHDGESYDARIKLDNWEAVIVTEGPGSDTIAPDISPH